MAIGYTSILKIAKPDAGTQTWATYFHRLADVIDNLHGGVVTVTKAAGATTLPFASGVTDKGKRAILRTAIALTSAVTVNVPAIDRLWLAENLSSGTGTWKIQTSGNIGVIVPQGKRMLLRSSATGVVAASKVAGQITSATELGANVVTATNAALKAASVVAASLATGAVTLPKIAGGASYGRIMYTATAAGFAWTTLARGTANQVLAMSTSAAPKPSWVTRAFRKQATSTAISFALSDIITYTHGITGITNKYDVFVSTMLECNAADAGYSVGDVIYGDITSGDSHPGITTVVDALTSAKVNINASGIAAQNKSTQATATLTASKWWLRVRVVAIN